MTPSMDRYCIFINFLPDIDAIALNIECMEKMKRMSFNLSLAPNL